MSDSLSVEQRLARLEAIEAIKRLKYAYFEACDKKQPERVRECFATGPIDLDYGRIGKFTDREAMLAVFSELACQPHIIEMHHGQNPQVVVSDEANATATWALYYFMIDTRRQLVTQLAGFYDDAYVCHQGRWQIVKSHYAVTSTQIFELGEGLAKVIFAGGSAPPELDDPGAQAG